MPFVRQGRLRPTSLLGRQDSFLIEYGACLKAIVGLFLCECENQAGQLSVRVVKGVWAKFCRRPIFLLLIQECFACILYQKSFPNVGVNEHWNCFKHLYQLCTRTCLIKRRTLNLFKRDLGNLVCLSLGITTNFVLSFVKQLSLHVWYSGGGQIELVNTYFWTPQGCQPLQTTAEDVPLISPGHCLDFMELGGLPRSTLIQRTSSHCAPTYRPVGSRYTPRNNGVVNVVVIIGYDGAGCCSGPAGFTLDVAHGEVTWLLTTQRSYLQCTGN